ncbi:sugar phosphate nucleotidyltransferase [Terribacillus halophilus]|uniref:sugar phosphate nucleotidyltransferase n=1 Tax=Terribacillus halophilus TaxID=361279 RepID=UPI003982C452
MHTILLSGGSGLRLWPLSNGVRSKQFLKVLQRDKEDKLQSMIQRVWEQLNKCNLTKNSIVATTVTQVEAIRNQIGEEVSIVVEPSRRDTFPAIALSCVYLYSEKNAPLDEIVSVLPVDPYVENAFFEKVVSMEKVLNDSQADIALIGVEPTFPSEKYGYIVTDKSPVSGTYYNVDSFVEKPTINLAEELISNEALWNCGVFSFRLGYLINLLKEKGYPITYHELKKDYERLPKNSFDYEVLEKTNNIVAIPYKGYWKDLGTWNTLSEEVSSSIIGKGLIEKDVQNSNLFNELDIPVILMGLDNTVVAASPDGILVTSKEASPRIKNYVELIKEQPMYEEKEWGWIKILDHSYNPDKSEIFTKKLSIKPHNVTDSHSHSLRDETWIIVSGKGVITLNGEVNDFTPGDKFDIPKGTIHSLKATTAVELIEMQIGEIDSSDIYLENVEEGMIKN